jgi:hypothetical protein
MFPEFNRQRFNNVITGDATWVNFFEPHRKIDNKIWATKKTLEGQQLQKEHQVSRKLW